MDNRLFKVDTTPLVISHEVLSDSYEFEPSQSPLAEYVLHSMPADIAKIPPDQSASREELAAKHSLILGEVRPVIESNTDPDIAKVTHLDLMFMFGCYIPAGERMYQVAPPELMSLIQFQSDRFENLDPYMTYDLIIDANTAELYKTGHMRTFLTGEDALHERDFYLGHTIAEREIRKAAYAIKDLVHRPALYDPKEVFEDAFINMYEFDNVMKEYGRFDPRAFAKLRPYLAAYADGTRNASGAFMPSVQLLELTLHKPTEMYKLFIEESMPYFPKWAQPVIAQWLEDSSNGENIADLLKFGEIEVDESSKGNLLSTIDRFVTFRMRHLGITRKQIPEAFAEGDKLSRNAIKAILREMQIKSPDVAGTGGFDVKNVLVNSVVRLNQLRDSIESVE